MTKKAPRSKKASSRKSMLVEAASVFAECAFATAQGMDRGMAAAAETRLYVLEPAARDFWLAGHARAIPKALKTIRWKPFRETILGIAQNLGQFAIEFALADAAATDPAIIVKRTHVKGATKKVQDTETRCAKGKGGEGIFCDF